MKQSWSQGIPARLGMVVLLISALVILPWRGGPAAATPANGVAKSNSNLKFFVNFIGGPEITFFAVVQRGVQAAAKDLGVNAVFQGPKCCDITLQAQLLQSEVAAKPDGIAVEFNDPKALSGTILRALGKNIPVILVNTQNFAADTDPSVKSLAYVGQDELLSGGKVGALLAPYLTKGTQVVCVNPGPAQIVQTIRCDGVKAYLAKLGIQSSTLVDQVTVPSEGEAIIDGYMHAHSGTTGIVTLNPETTSYACKWIQDHNKMGKVFLGSYDLAPATLNCIQQGVDKFTLVQQPFVQGYLSVVDLYLKARYGMAPSNINTGTAVVTKDNASQFQALVASGIGG